MVSVFQKRLHTKFLYFLSQSLLSGTYFILRMQQYLRIVVSIADTHSSSITGTEGVQAVMAVVVAVVDAAQGVAKPAVRPEPRDIIL